MIATLLLLFWILFLVAVITGTWTLFQQLKTQDFTRQTPEFPLFGISILKPLKGADVNLYENLESFFQLKTEIPHELLFSLESRNDAAFPTLTQLRKQYPNAPAKLFILDEIKDELKTESSFGKNPKLRNMSASFNAAHFDAIFISDSNVKIKTGELEALANALDEKTGMVTAIVSGVNFSGLGGALESVFLGTFYARFMALCNRYAKPCVVGKAMLFRKSDLLRVGGFTLLSDFLAEDFMAGETMQKLGLLVKTSPIPVNQILGKYSFKTFWGRHVRWGRIRKSHAPLAFFCEPFFSPISMSSLGAYALHSLFQIPFGLTLIVSWGVLCILDGLCYIRSTRNSLPFIACFPIIWTLREILSLPLWIKIASGNDIDWRGNRFTLAPGGLLRDK